MGVPHTTTAVLVSLLPLVVSLVSSTLAGTPTCPLGASSSQYTLYLFDKNTEVPEWGARCLDGSPAGFYLQCGHGSGLTKLVIFLQGGGYCLPDGIAISNIENCSARINNQYGTSKKWANTTTPWSGITNPGTNVNPDFYNWNLIQVPYCSGDIHAGQRNTSVNGYYQAGHLIFKAILAKLSEVGILGNFTDIILTGSSAGGSGAHINIDYLAKAAPKAAVSVFPQAGWIVPYNAYPDSGVISVVNASTLIASTIDAYVNPACGAANGGVPGPGWICLGAVYSFPYWGVRSFVAQNKWDFDQLTNRDGLPDYNPNSTTTCNFVSGFGVAMNSSLQEVTASPGSETGLWLPACLNHPLDWNKVTIPSSGGTTLQELFGAWYYGRPVNVSSIQSYKAIDGCVGLECNPTCHDLLNTTACAAFVSTTTSSSSSAGFATSLLIESLLRLFL